VATVRAELTAPSAAEVDEKAAHYSALKEALLRATEAAERAKVPLDALKEELVETVRAFGSTHAEKSRILHGIGWELMATFGSSVSYDAAAVELFRVALYNCDKTRLLKKIFLKEIRWSLMPGATEIIKSEKLSNPLLALYSQCEVVKPKTPSLSVREKSA
jgi:hypothetical protein